MDLLDLNRTVRPQCDYVLPFPAHLDLTLLLLPGNLVGHATPSRTITLPRHLSDGSRDNCQHDCLRLRPSLGWKDHQACTCSALRKCANQDSDRARLGHCGGSTLC